MTASEKRCEEINGDITDAFIVRKEFDDEKENLTRIELIHKS
jgi:hypothetical protein